MLSKLVKEGLIEQEKVVVSGLGTFYTLPVPATFSQDGKSIIPPSLKICFEYAPNCKDDFLATFYSQLNNVDSTIAKEEVESLLKELKSHLSSEGVIEIPEIGKINVNKNSIAQFTSADNGTLFSTVYGFEPISIKPLIEKESISPISSDISESPSDEISEGSSEVEVEVVSAQEGKKATAQEDEDSALGEENTEQREEETAHREKATAQEDEDSVLREENTEQREEATAQGDKNSTHRDEATAQGDENNAEELTENMKDKGEEESPENLQKGSMESVKDSKEDSDNGPSEDSTSDTTTGLSNPVKPSRRGLKIFIAIAATIIIIIAAIIALGATGALDTLLYTPEELELIDKFGN